MLVIYFLLFLMVCIWAFSFVLVDLTIQFIPPLSLALYRFIIASLSFLLIDIFKRFRKKTRNSRENVMSYKHYTRIDWIYLLLSSFSGVSLFFFIQYAAIDFVGPTLPALFVCLLSPLFISLLAFFLFDERLNKVKITGFLISSIGAFYLVTGGDLFNLTPNSPNFVGYVLALLTPFLWALYSTFTKLLSKKQSNMVLNKYISYLGTIELFFLVLINNELDLLFSNIFNFSTISAALYLGIGCYVLGYYVWQRSQNTLKSFKVASFLYLEPFITLLFSLFLQRPEVIVIWNVLGGLIVLIGVLMINYD